MKIGIIQASSQSDKNELICDSVHKYAGDSEIVNFGCFRDDIEKYRKEEEFISLHNRFITTFKRKNN